MFKYLFLFRKIFLTKQFRFSYGQFGEDIPLYMLFRKRLRGKGFFVDVGAYHPTKWSNTYYFYKRGWRGINIDMEPLKVDALKFRRPFDVNVCAAVSDSAEPVKHYSFGRYEVCATIDQELGEERGRGQVVPQMVYPRPLSDIIDETRFKNRQIDLLSVDCEGHDLNVLKSLDFKRYRPKVIAVEIYAKDLHGIVASDTTAFLEGLDYALVNCVGLTAIFADREFLGDGPVF